MTTSMIARWLFVELRQLVVNFVRTHFVDWVLDQLRSLCEHAARRIADYQEQARAAGVNHDALRVKFVGGLGAVASELGARLIAEAETLSAEDAVTMFAAALEQVAD